MCSNAMFARAEESRGSSLVSVVLVVADLPKADIYASLRISMASACDTLTICRSAGPRPSQTIKCILIFYTRTTPKAMGRLSGSMR